VTFHCAGMCGPIMAGLVTHNTRVPRDASRSEMLRVRAQGVLGYQAGRALTYAALGALAGGLGGAVASHMRTWTGITTLLCAGCIIAIALYKLIPWRTSGPPGQSTWAAQGRWLGRVMRRLSALTPARGAKKMMLFGVVMGLLPCMLMFWVLNLAVASASVWHGALLMVGLVVMTTPVLLGSGCSTSLIPASWRARGDRLVPVGLLISGVWTGLIGAATQGYIEHVHLPFRLFGELYTFMLW
jgi:sulfite exporter TauE/SafE